MGKYVFGFIAVVFVSITFTEQYSKKCDELGINVYEQLGCKVLKTKNGCPVKYRCPKYKIADGQTCMVGGKLIKQGERIPGNNNCMFCNCDKPFSLEGDYQFPCAVMDCARPQEPQEGCYNRMGLGSCCPGTEYCPDNSTETCLVDGNTYTEYQVFRPEDTCLECECQKGFKPNEEPFCRRTPCGLEVNYFSYLEQDCTPFYVASKALCCPTGFICDEAIKHICKIEMASSSSGIHCFLNGKAYPLHSKFAVDFTYKSADYKANCECKVAPHPTCILV